MSDITIHIDGEEFSLDDFSLGDLEWLEEFIDAPLSDGQALGRMKTAVGFVYLVKRRADPAFTIDQAREIKLAAIEAPDEPEPGAKRPPKRAARR